jgi:hypothetical protein
MALQDVFNCEDRNGILVEFTEQKI